MATAVLPEASCTCETYAAPASRASWCGQLKLGTQSVPVKAYAAISRRFGLLLREAAYLEQFGYPTPANALRD